MKIMVPVVSFLCNFIIAGSDFICGCLSLGVFAAILKYVLFCLLKKAFLGTFWKCDFEKDSDFETYVKLSSTIFVLILV
jgi:hypothetical protein